MTGLELRLRRTAQRVKVTDLARVMGVQHSRVSQIEATAQVTQRAAARYLGALATFPDVDSAERRVA
jgi:transcriptional regulator with XRE-family HTH domain